MCLKNGGGSADFFALLATSHDMRSSFHALVLVWKEDEGLVKSERRTFWFADIRRGLFVSSHPIVPDRPSSRYPIITAPSLCFKYGYAISKRGSRISILKATLDPASSVRLNTSLRLWPQPCVDYANFRRTGIVSRTSHHFSCWCFAMSWPNVVLFQVVLERSA